MQRPMSMNGYSWVEGRVIDYVDPSGLQFEPENPPVGVPRPSYGGGANGPVRGGGGGTTSSGGFRQPGVNPLDNPIAPGSPRPSPRQSSPAPPARPNPSLQSPAGTGQVTGVVTHPQVIPLVNYGGASLALLLMMRFALLMKFCQMLFRLRNQLVNQM